MSPVVSALFTLCLTATVPSLASAIDLDTLPVPLAIDTSTPPPATKSGAATASALKSGRTAAPTSARHYDRDRLLADGVAKLEALVLSSELGVAPSARRHLASPDAVRTWDRLMRRNGDALRLVFDSHTGTPRFIQGVVLDDPSIPAPAHPEEAAARLLDEIAPLLRLEDASAELLAYQSLAGRDGTVAIRHAQAYRGLRVWGRDLIVRVDDSGRVTGVSARTVPSPVGISIEPTVSESAARTTALASMPATGVTATVEETELVFYGRDAVSLAWRVRASAGLAHRDDVFVDAENGLILGRETLVPHGGGAITGSGVDLSGTTRSLELYEDGGTVFMINTTKDMFDASGTLPQEGKGVINLLDARNGDGSQLFFVTSPSATSWTGFENAVSAAFFADLVYDYFRSAHDRVSIDAAGMNMNLIVNFQNGFNNAFWNGTFMVFGNGDGTSFSDLAGTLDVTAHEMSHGVIEHTANLVYEFQSGALNEHFADVFGVSTDFHHNGAEANWLLGEDVTTPAIAGDCLRNMEHPDGADVAFGGQQPAHMDQFQDLPIDQDNGGVHINSGIPNRAYFLAATTGGMTVAKAEEIWYRTLSMYLNRNSQFADFRLGIRQAAADLHGAGSLEQDAVTAALDAVGMTAEEDTDDPVDLPDNEGVDFLSVIDAGSGEIVAVSVPVGEGSTIDAISGGLSIADGGRPSFADDGSAMAFVGSDQHVYLAAEGSIFQISADPEWWSVALSAGGRFLAATPFVEDNTIFVFDLIEPGNSAAFELATQTSGESGSDNILYADVLEFAVGGDFLVYDALHNVSIDGADAQYWDINFLRLTDGLSFRVLQPLPSNESVGNPTFAQNSDNTLAFDYLAGDGNIYVVAVDVVTGESGIVTNNFSSLGRPTFAGDDAGIYYEFTNGGGSSIWFVSLAADGLTGAGDDTQLLTGGFWPVHFTVGVRETPVLLESLAGSWSESTVSLSWRAPARIPMFEIERAGDAGSFESRTPTPLLASELADETGLCTWSDVVDVDAARLTYRIVGIDAHGERQELGRLTVLPSGTLSAQGAIMLPASPNPLVDATRLRVVIPRSLTGVPVTLEIFDVSGRRVARPIAGEVLAEGRYDIRWDATDGRGSRLPAGEYVALLRGGRQRVATKIMVMSR